VAVDLLLVLDFFLEQIVANKKQWLFWSSHIEVTCNFRSSVCHTAAQRDLTAFSNRGHRLSESWHEQLVPAVFSFQHNIQFNLYSVVYIIFLNVFLKSFFYS